MAWQVSRDALFAAFKVLDLVPSKANCPSSDFFRIDPQEDNFIRICTAGSAIADIRLKGIGRWPYDDGFYVDRRKITPFVTVAQGIKNKLNFVFSAGKGFLMVEHGSRNVKLFPQSTIMGYAEAPEMPKSSTLNFGNKQFLEILQCAAACSSTEQRDPHLACVYLVPTDSGLQMLATDKSVVLRIKTKLDVGFRREVPFPLGMMSVVGTEDVESVKWDNRCMLAKFPNGVIWQTISEKAKVDFPVEHFNIVFKDKRNARKVCVVGADTLAKKVQRMAFYLQSVRKEDWVLRINGEKNQNTMLVQCRLQDSRFEETLRALEPCPEDFQLDWEIDTVSPIFDFIGKVNEKQVATIHLSNDGRVSFVSCGDLELMLPSRRI